MMKVAVIEVLAALIATLCVVQGESVSLPPAYDDNGTDKFWSIAKRVFDSTRGLDEKRDPLWMNKMLGGKKKRSVSYEPTKTATGLANEKPVIKAELEDMEERVEQMRKEFLEHLLANEFLRQLNADDGYTQGTGDSKEYDSEEENKRVFGSARLAGKRSISGHAMAEDMNEGYLQSMGGENLRGRRMRRSTDDSLPKRSMLWLHPRIPWRDNIPRARVSDATPGYRPYEKQSPSIRCRFAHWRPGNICK